MSAYVNRDECSWGSAEARFTTAACPAKAAASLSVSKSDTEIGLAPGLLIVGVFAGLRARSLRAVSVKLARLRHQSLATLCRFCSAIGHRSEKSGLHSLRR
ncbi:MAG: hypothetical protein QOI30_2552 [Mycobacterium sp.]|jgi:hypothetical protein|nr:hypothetical protein [Mycobacterium sp.]MEA3105054.1 hypothetical protein [Caballeronia mineralivorans]